MINLFKIPHGKWLLLRHKENKKNWAYLFIYKMLYIIFNHSERKLKKMVRNSKRTIDKIQLMWLIDINTQWILVRKIELKTQNNIIPGISTVHRRPEFHRIKFCIMIGWNFVSIACFQFFQAFPRDLQSEWNPDYELATLKSGLLWLPCMPACNMLIAVVCYPARE